MRAGGHSEWPGYNVAFARSGTFLQPRGSLYASNDTYVSMFVEKHRWNNGDGITLSGEEVSCALHVSRRIGSTWNQPHGGMATNGSESVLCTLEVWCT